MKKVASSICHIAAIFCGTDFVGTVLMVGVRGDEFCDVSGANFLMEVLRHA